MSFAAKVRQLSDEAARTLLRSPISEEKRETVLHQALKSGSAELIDLCVARGADVNARDTAGCTPVFWASTPARLRAFLNAAEAHGSSVDLTAQDKMGTTAEEVVSLMMQSGAVGGEVEHQAAFRARIFDELAFETAQAGGEGSAVGFAEEEETYGSERDLREAIADALVAEERARRAREQAREEEEARAAAEAARPSTPPAADFASGEDDGASDGECSAKRRKRRPREAPAAPAPSSSSEALAAACARYSSAWVRLLRACGAQDATEGGGGRAADGCGESGGDERDGEPIGFDQVPWPSLRPPRAHAGLQIEPVDAREVEAILMHGTTPGEAARRATLRNEMRRWHPDKFPPRRVRLASRERALILERVTAVSQAIVELMGVRSAA